MTQSSATRPRALRRFVIDATRCELKVGDYVHPVTDIGNDPETGAMIRSGFLAVRLRQSTLCRRNTRLVFSRHSRLDRRQKKLQYNKQEEASKRASFYFHFYSDRSD